MNTTMVVDHHGLFIYLDLKYLGSFHDVNIFLQLGTHMNWSQHFAHINEYLSGDLGYVGKDIFVMQHIGRCELALGINLAAIATYNKMHADIFLKTTFSFHLY
jgi:hypothetical protein